jgi:hypothetical protein
MQTFNQIRQGKSSFGCAVSPKDGAVVSCQANLQHARGIAGTWRRGVGTTYNLSVSISAVPGEPLEVYASSQLANEQLELGEARGKHRHGVGVQGVQSLLVHFAHVQIIGPARQRVTQVQCCDGMEYVLVIVLVVVANSSRSLARLALLLS